MLFSPDARQMRSEADRISQVDGKLNPSGITIVSRDEVVEPQPRELYRPPHFLPKTASPDQVAELDDILGELWAVNQRHVGEKVLAVDAYYSVTDYSGPLQERARAWSQAYFEQRSDRSRLSPRDRNDPFEMFQRLLDEYDRVLGQLGRRNAALNHLFLNLCHMYVPWLLFNRLWRDLLEVNPDGTAWLRYRPAKPESPALMMAYLLQERWLANDLADFFGEVGSHTDPARLAVIDREPDTALVARLARMADDIQEMRRFLVKDFNPRKAIVSPGAGLAVAWTWSVRFGIANLIADAPGADILRALESREVRLHASVSHEGILFDYCKPWSTADRAAPVNGVRPVVLNCFLLEQMHERLFSFYDQIDFDRVRSRAWSGPADDQSEAEAVAMSCQDLADGPPEVEGGREVAPRPGRRPIRTPRSQRLLGLLASRFGCDVQHGKGSEITIHRRGGKKCILGHHKRNDTVPSVVVGRLLKQLGIGLLEWLEVVYGK